MPSARDAHPHRTAATVYRRRRGDIENVPSVPTTRGFTTGADGLVDRRASDFATEFVDLPAGLDDCIRIEVKRPVLSASDAPVPAIAAITPSNNTLTPGHIAEHRPRPWEELARGYASAVVHAPRTQGSGGSDARLASWRARSSW